MELVTIVNRSSKNLQGTWDGRHYDLAPGKHSFPLLQAEAFKRQNPVMGSEDPRSLQVEYLIGIEEQRDDCSPIEQSESVERWDRKKLGGRAVDIIQGPGVGMYDVRSAPLSPDASFVKP